MLKRLLGLGTPKNMNREESEQVRLDELTSKVRLYHFVTCPYCLKVRRYIQGEGLNIEMRDIKKSQAYFDELVSGGGKKQVPCLRIEKEDGSIKWMYESDDIIDYLGSL